MTLALPILVLLLASCAVPTPPTCQGDPFASGEVIQISPFSATLCTYGLSGTSIISDQATYDDFADKCLGTWGTPPELPPVDFRHRSDPASSAGQLLQFGARVRAPLGAWWTTGLSRRHLGGVSRDQAAAAKASPGGNPSSDSQSSTFTPVTAS